MFKFSKEEVLVTVIIFALVGTISFFNFKDALKRSRDSTRRDEVGAISNALHQFHADFGYFPPSENGKIKYCKGDNFEEVMEEISDDPELDKQKYFEGLRTCEWGEDAFDDLLDDDYPPYLNRIPVDPGAENGYEYYYLSNLNRYQIYTHLEEDVDALGYDPGIADRNLDCGIGVCSFGKSYSNTPLDMSLEEYEKILEKELLENSK